MPIDLRSDTVTRPSDRMRQAVADAEVGDDVYGEDPTVNELEARAAEVVGTEAALFVPSGTMGNQVAARTHTDPGQEVLVELESHIYRWELGGLAQHAGLQTRTIDGSPRGAVEPAAVRAGYVSADAHRPGTGLLCLENTHNARGGTALEPAVIAAAAEAAHDLAVPVHLDGARLFDAAVALDVPASRFVDPVDSVMFCLSKGLGAPVGSILAGPVDFIQQARRIRKLQGGGMRQAGIIAAPGMIALENRSHLGRVHDNARIFADGLGDLPGLDVRPPETNIVLVETDRSAEAFLEHCGDAGVLGVLVDDHRARFCTHLDLDRAEVTTAVERVGDAVRTW